MSQGNAEDFLLPGKGWLYYAPLGTAYPETVDDPIDEDDWTCTGFTEEDGVSIKISPQSKEFFSWQAEAPTKRKRKRTVLSLSCKLQEINRANIILNLGGTIEGTDGDQTFWPPTPEDDTPEWAFLLHLEDGDRVDRFGFFRGQADSDTDLVFNADALTNLPVMVTPLDPGDYADPDHPGVPWFWRSNSSAFDEPAPTSP